MVDEVTCQSATPPEIGADRRSKFELLGAVGQASEQVKGARCTAEALSNIRERELDGLTHVLDLIQRLLLANLEARSLLGKEVLVIGGGHGVLRGCCERSWLREDVGDV